MNNDNPYAAPQTNLQPTPSDALPVAEGADLEKRRLFPDLDTESLRLLAAQSRAIAEMPWVWLMLLILIGMPFGFFMRFTDQDPGSYVLKVAMIFLAGLVLTVLRFALGFSRTKTNRIFFLIMDGLLTAAGVLGFLAFLFGFLTRFSIDLFVGSVIFGLLSTIGWRACKALVHAPELFEAGRFPHKQLIQELKYRQKHDII